MPDWKEILRDRFRLEDPAASRETEIFEELSQELDQIYRDAIAGGKSREEAMEIALSELGDTGSLGQDIKRAVTPSVVDRTSNGKHGPGRLASALPERTGNIFSDLVRDMGHGFRLLLRRPGFSAVVVLTLALGIGANTAVFSVINSVIFEPLPYGSPEVLVMLWETDRVTYQGPVSGPNFLDWREQSQSLENMGAIVNRHVNLSGGDQPERVRGCLVSAGTLALLEVPPLQGRTLVREDEEPGSERVVLISHNLWQRRFSGNPQLLGQTISLNGDPFTVVGIMPPGFQHPSPWTTGSWIDVWMAMPRDYLDDDRAWHKLVVIGRLKEGVSRETAQQEMNTIAARLQQQYPDTNEGQGIWVAPLLLVLVGRTAGQLVLLFCFSAVLLLIACGNVAGLLIARATVRQPEVAIRASLGASRGRLVRELVAENLPLFLLGGAVSLLLASWGLGSLRSLIPASIPRAGEVTIDVTVMIFATVLALLTGLVFGLVPALAAVNRELTGVLNQGTGSGQVRLGRSRSRVKMMVAQVALTLVLANAAALMLRSYMRISNMEYGFSSENVVTMGLSLAGSRYDSAEKVRAFYDQALEKVAALW
jgi:putative ABC transport system permease protein